MKDRRKEQEPISIFEYFLQEELEAQYAEHKGND